MYQNTFYRVSTKALIKNKQGYILVLKENQDTWSLPGGGLDHGEDPRKGILREMKEELGIENATIKDITAVKTFYFESKSAWLLWIIYEVKINDGDFILGEGVTEAQFLDPNTLSTSKDIFERMVYDASSHSQLY